MAISKIILNGVTQMDVTGKTVTSASMRNGITALKNDGTDITGSIQDMTLPSASSSTSSGTSKATITPTSSAQYLNIPAGYLETAQYYTIAAASGGASNIVTGTFKGTTTGAAMDVTLNYTGSGYPVAAVIYPKDGVRGDSSFNALIQRYVTAMFCVTKAFVATIPAYNKAVSVDEYIILHRYKSSTSSASSYSQTGNQAYITTGVDATSTNINIMNFKSKTKMSVFIASNSYGFAANIEYTYYIIYSS